MSRSSKRTITKLAAVLLAAAGALGAVGFTLVDGQSPAGATPTGPPAIAVPRVSPQQPDFDELLRTADFVSEDGSYVQLGPVGMSAASVVRAAPGS